MCWNRLRCFCLIVTLSLVGESLGQALDRAFAERIKLPEGDTAHAGAPIQDTRAAPIPGPPSPPSAKDGNGQQKTEAEGDIDQPTETTAVGIAQAGHEQTEAVDASQSAAAPHSGGPTGAACFCMPKCRHRYRLWKPAHSEHA